jgi:hypothetical protein
VTDLHLSGFAVVLREPKRSGTFNVQDQSHYAASLMLTRQSLVETFFKVQKLDNILMDPRKEKKKNLHTITGWAGGC